MSAEYSLVKPPNWFLAGTDVARACLEATAVVSQFWWARNLPRGDGHPVLVIPGFAGDDTYNRPLISFLRRHGYHAVGWKQGRNMGHSSVDAQHLGQRIKKLFEHEERKISLVGHSLGGVFAREAARRHPDRVRQVISLGSPIGDCRDEASALNRVYQQLNRRPGQIDESQWHVAPPIPTTAVYTRADGVLDWRACLQTGGHRETENIEVFGSHNGLTLNALVWLLLCDRLAQPDGGWTPFRAGGWLRLVYPAPAWDARFFDQTENTSPNRA